MPDDLGPSEGRRTVILVSDGGDNCAPPDPCEAAREVSKQGIDLSISVVGLQVNERVRRQLECIAKAGGGTYVGVDDADELADELAAALSRAFRSYETAGTKVTGGPAREQAVALQAGLFQDALRPGETRWYAVDVPEGRRLLTSVSAIPSYEDVRPERAADRAPGPRRPRIEGDAEVLLGRAAGDSGRVRAQSLSMPEFAGTGGLPRGATRSASRSRTGSTPTRCRSSSASSCCSRARRPGSRARPVSSARRRRPRRRPSRHPAPATRPSPPRACARPWSPSRRSEGIALGLLAALVLTRRRVA